MNPLPPDPQPPAPPSPLLAVPNISEGRDHRTIEAVAGAFPRLLAVHADPDHNRAVFTAAGAPGELAAQVLEAAALVIDRINVFDHGGIHPRIGAIDVAPVVHLSEDQQGAACAEALVLGDMLGDELALPVFLYGALAGGRSRAELRRGGLAALRDRMAAGELAPDFGPTTLHPSAGAVLVGARPPLIAFNVELAPPSELDDAIAIAAEIREGGRAGLPGVRAIGLWLSTRERAQVSMNLEDHRSTSPADVVAAIATRAAVAETELVGLAPAEALLDFPPEVPIRNRRTIEEALALTA